MATDKLYKLTDEQSRWVENKVMIPEGYWVPDPVDNENPFGIPGDPIEIGWHTSGGSGSGPSDPSDPPTECQAVRVTVLVNPGYNPQFEDPIYMETFMCEGST